MADILVTGGGGYVGSVLVPELLCKGHNVSVIDIMFFNNQSLDQNISNPRFSLLKGDIRDNDLLNSSTKGIDVLIHLAAMSNDPTADLNPEITKNINLNAVESLVKISKNNGIKRFINASSSSMYGIKDRTPATEESECNPISLYAKYKLESEKFVDAASSGNFVTVNIRPATICGFSPRQRFDLSVNALTYSALKKGQITVHGGQQWRPNVTIKDLTRLYCRLVDIDQRLINGETFNCGFENLCMQDIALKVKSVLDQYMQTKIIIEPIYDKRDFLLDSSKLINTLNFKPRYSISDAVEDLYNAYIRKEFYHDEDDYYNLKKLNRENFK